MSVDPQGPKVGADEWVARQAHRREYLPSWLGDAQRRAERIGWWPQAGDRRAGRPGPAAARPGRFPAAGRHRRAGDRAAGGGAEHRGGLGRAARPRLRRVLRLRRVRVRAALLVPARRQRHPPALLAVAADRDDRRGAPRAGRRAAVPAAARRLPGHRDAVPRRGVRRVHQQRGAVQAGRAERDHRDRPDPGLRRPADYQQQLLLPAGDRAGGHDGGAAAARVLAHRPGLARGPRGPAGGGGDDDPGQPGEAVGVRLRRHGRGAGRDHLRRPAGERVPHRLRHPDPDPDLRRAHPRRHGQHRGRGDRRAGGDGHLRRSAAQPGRGQLPVLRTWPADPAGQAAPLAQAGRGPRQRPSRSASRRTRSPRPSRPARSRPGRSRAAGSATGCATG